MKVALDRPKKVHIVGIGGLGAYYLALFLHYLGWKISGSDCQENERVQKLKQLGLKIFLGHEIKNLNHQPELIVISAAIPLNVPELQLARKKKIKIISYHQFLDDIFSQLKLAQVRKRFVSALRQSNFAPLYQLDLDQAQIIGVTGTDGKTTTSSMIYHILQTNQIKAGMITTVMAKMGSQEINTGLHTTTPPAQQLAPIISQMIEAKISWLVLEITSHALAQHRVEGLQLAGAVYTNVTEEHLDFHKTWERYLEDKAKMIAMVQPGGFVVLNRDDRSFNFLKKEVQRYRLLLLSYGHHRADLRASQIQTSLNQTRAILKFKDRNYSLRLPIPGAYNIENAMAAILAANQIGVPINLAVKALASFPGVAGRMTIIQKKPFVVLVDFAHTPNGLTRALKSARRLAGENGRILVVFGAAGLRDPFKRPKMGQVAAELADIIILAPEDPRTEKVTQINNQIIQGIKQPGAIFSEKSPITRKQIEKELEQDKKVIVRFDKDSPSARKKALVWAIKNARPGDVVIACGKGHEKSLCFGNTEHPWDEIKIIQKIIQKSNKKVD